MPKSSPILDLLVEACQEMLKLSTNLRGRPEEAEALEALRHTASMALAHARGAQILAERE